MDYFKQKFRDIKKFPTWIYWFPAMLMRVIFHTLYRFRIEDPYDSMHATHSIGMAWHNRLCFFAVAFPAYQRKRSVAMVSASRDGQYVSDFIAQFGLKSVRGSSSRHGAAAQLAAIREIETGKNVIFTPDGPRGPRYKIKAGPIHLASRTGSPIVPIALNASRYWQVHSWDGFQIPKPFAKVTLILGEPIHVPPDLNAGEIETYRQLVEKRMLEITRDADAAVPGTPRA